MGTPAISAESASMLEMKAEYDRVKKELDRYSFEATEYLLYDSANQKVVRKVKKMPAFMGRSKRPSADGSEWLCTRGGVC